MTVVARHHPECAWTPGGDDHLCSCAGRGPVLEPRWSVSVYLTHARTVLLVRHVALAMWLPVGGRVEEGETPSQAARREAFEETGRRATNLVYLGYDEHPAGSELHMNHAFAASVEAVFVADKILPLVRSDGSWSEHVWLEWDAAPPEPTPPNVRAALAEVARVMGGRDHEDSLQRDARDRERARELASSMKLGERGYAVLLSHLHHVRREERAALVAASARKRVLNPYCEPWVVAMRRAPHVAVCVDETCALSGGFAHVGDCEPCGCPLRHAADECPHLRKDACGTCGGTGYVRCVPCSGKGILPEPALEATA